MLDHGVITSLGLTGLLVSIGLTKKHDLHIPVFLNQCHICCLFKSGSACRFSSNFCSPYTSQIPFNTASCTALCPPSTGSASLARISTFPSRRPHWCYWNSLKQAEKPRPSWCVCNEAVHLCTLLRASFGPVFLGVGHFLQMQDTDCCWELQVGSSVRRPWLKWHPFFHHFFRWGDNLGVLAHFQVLSMCTAYRQSLGTSFRSGNPSGSRVKIKSG